MKRRDNSLGQQAQPCAGVAWARPGRVILFCTHLYLYAARHILRLQRRRCGHMTAAAKPYTQILTTYFYARYFIIYTKV